MAKTYDFIVNTENVNSYGFRILTDGIDTEQYMRNPVVLYGHNRREYNPQGDEVIGRVVKLRKEERKLIATVEFDEKDEFARKIAGKVERGYIRMASINAEVIEASMAEEYVLPGQTLETVIKCKMVELSIVDIGGNDDALRLSKDGKPVKLNKIKPIENKKNMEFTTIALALGMSGKPDENAVLEEIKSLKLDKETAEKKNISLQKRVDEVEQSERTTLIDKAVQLGLIPEEMKEMTETAFKGDHDGQKAILTKLIADKEKDLQEDGNQSKVREVVLGNGKKPNKDIELSFDYLQKHNVVELRRIAKEEPEQYAQLVKEYKAGKRYVATK